MSLEEEARRELERIEREKTLLAAANELDLADRRRRSAELADRLRDLDLPRYDLPILYDRSRVFGGRSGTAVRVWPITEYVPPDSEGSGWTFGRAIAADGTWYAFDSAGGHEIEPPGQAEIMKVALRAFSNDRFDLADAAFRKHWVLPVSLPVMIMVGVALCAGICYAAISLWDYLSTLRPAVR